MDTLLETYKDYEILLSNRVNGGKRGWVAKYKDKSGFCNDSKAPEKKLIEVAKRVIDQYGKESRLTKS